MEGNDNKSKPVIGRGVSQSYTYIALLLLFCFGVLLSVFLFNNSRDLENNRIEFEFMESAKNRVSAFNKLIADYLHELEALDAFYSASNVVTRSDFHVFTSKLMTHYRGTQALEWIPRVSYSELPDYEAAARKEGFSDFRVSEHNDQGMLVKAGDRQEYFPVYYVEPLKGNENALGFDLASNSERLKGLNKARNTGLPSATSRIRLVQDKEGGFSILIFNPVYLENISTSLGDAMEERFRGFVLGVFKIRDLMEETMASFTPAGMDIYLYDDSAAENARFLYFYSSPTRDIPAEPDSLIPERIHGLQYTDTINVADRKWSVLIIPTTDYIASRRAWLLWATLAGGIVFSGVVTGYISLILARIKRARQYGAEREIMVRDLKATLSQVKTLSGMLPICASCKKIRDDKGYWNQVADYISEHTNVEFSHGICPECSKSLYPKYHKIDEENA